MLPGFNVPSRSTAAVLAAVRCKLVLSVLFLVLLVATRTGTSAQNQNTEHPESSESSTAVDTSASATKPSPPPNDKCYGAQKIINPAKNWCSTSFSFYFNTEGATSDDIVPYPPYLIDACNKNMPHCSSNTCGAWTNTTMDVWFQWQAPETGTYTFSTCGSTFDTVIALYSLVNFFYQCESLVLLTCNDDDCDSCRDGKSSTVYWYARKDEMFFLRVGGKNQAVGWGTLTIALGPSNDECDSAMSTGYNGTYFDTTFATSGVCRSNSYLPVPAYIQNTQSKNAVSFPTLNFTMYSSLTSYVNFCETWDCSTKDVWFNTTLTVGSKGIVGVQVSAFTTFPAMIALYTGSCSKLTLIGCYGGCENGKGGIFIKGYFSSKSIQSFYARVGGKGGTFGTGLIQWFTY